MWSRSCSGSWSARAALLAVALLLPTLVVFESRAPAQAQSTPPAVVGSTDFLHMDIHLVSPIWKHLPPGLRPGDKFRVVFLTANTRDATARQQQVYHNFVRTQAQNAGLPAWEEYRAYVCGSVPPITPNSSDPNMEVPTHLAYNLGIGIKNTRPDGTDYDNEKDSPHPLIQTFIKNDDDQTIGSVFSFPDTYAADVMTIPAGVPVYWLGGAKIHDNNVALFNSYGPRLPGKNEKGDKVTGVDQVWTGCMDGKIGSMETDLGSAMVSARNPSNGTTVKRDSSSQGHLYAVSPVMQVKRYKPQISIAHSGSFANQLMIDEGSEGDYLLKLTSEAIGDITITAKVKNGNIRLATTPGAGFDAASATASVSWTPGNWQEERRIYVTTKRDANLKDKPFTITHSFSGAVEDSYVNRGWTDVYKVHGKVKNIDKRDKPTSPQTFSIRWQGVVRKQCYISMSGGRNCFENTHLPMGKPFTSTTEIPVFSTSGAKPRKETLVALVSKNGRNRQFTFKYYLSGTAKLLGDYELPPGHTVTDESPPEGAEGVVVEATVPSGTRFLRIPITIIDDCHDDPDETIVLGLMSGDSYVWRGGHREFTVTIRNGKHSVTFDNGTSYQCREIPLSLQDESQFSFRSKEQVSVQETEPDPEVGVSADVAAITEGSAALFTFTAHPAPSEPLTISVDVTQQGDFASTGSRTVTIPTTGSITMTVPTADDGTDEPDGSVTVAVTSGNSYTVGAASRATVAVSDNDLPALPRQEMQGTETSVLESLIQARIDRTAANGNQWSNSIWRGALAAVQGEPPPPGSRRVTGELAQRIADNHGNGGRTELADLWQDIADALTGSATPPPPPPPPVLPDVTVTPGGDIVEGGTAIFTVAASPVPAAPLTVTVDISGQGDFADVGMRTVTVPETGTAVLIVPTVDDGVDEADGSLTATIQSGNGYTVSSPNTATVSVSDNDPPGTPQAAGSLNCDNSDVIVDEATVAEDKHWFSYLTFTVTLCEMNYGRVLIDYWMEGITADEDDLYFMGGTLIIEPFQQTARAIMAQVFSDHKTEGDETVALVLENPDPPSIDLGHGRVLGTITDPD